MKRAWRQILWTCGLVALAGVTAWAQGSGGALQGKIVDQTGQSVIGAIVTMTGPNVQGSLVAVTDTEGQYLLPQVPAGKNYQVRVEASGYNKVLRRGIDVALGATLNLPFSLSAGSTIITVVAAAPTVDLKSATTGVTLSDTLINSIPLQRDAGALAFLAPTAVNSGASTPGDASIGGSTGAENNYIINGVDVTDTGFGTNGSVLNFDFIQDMQILTGGLPPEYGAAMGGVVNAITRSGGNEFHGSLFGYYWSDKTQASGKTYVQAPNITGNDGYQRYDLGGSLGGYFIKDKLWFYAAYDYNRFKEYTAIPTGTAYGDQYLYLNGAPAQSVYSGQRITDDNEINPMYAFKLTWNASPNQKVALTFFGNDRRESYIGGANGAGLGTLSTVSAPYQIKESPYSLALQWNSTWTPKFFSEVNLSYRDRTQSYSVNPTAAANWSYSYLFSTGVYGGFQALPRDQTQAPAFIDPNDQTRIDLGGNYMASDGAGGLGGIPRDKSQQARIKFTNILGKHEVSYGLQYQKNDYTPVINQLSGPNIYSPAMHMDTSASLFVQWAPHGLLYDSSGNPFPVGPGGEQYVYAAQDYFTSGQRPSTENFNVGWINDNWALTQYFTLKLGLRYDEEKLTGDLTGNSINLTGNFAPRLGFTWDVTHDGKSKFYGFAGRYFERVPTDIAIRGLNNEISGQEYFFDPALTEWTGTSYIFGASEYVQGQSQPPPNTLTSAEAAAYSHKLKMPYTDEYILGYDYEARPDLTLGFRAVYRDLGRTIEDLSYDGANTYVIANPDQWTGVPVPSLLHPGGFVFFPKPVRRYEALEFTVDKRMANNWQMGGSFVYSRLKGNYEGAGSNDTTVGQLDPNLNATFDLPDFLEHGYGLLPLDRTWVLKAYGSYLCPNIPLELSANLEAQSGTPISKQIQVAWYGGAVGFAQDRGSSGRTPDTWSLDIGAEYRFKMPMKSNLGVRLDVFNVTNNQVETAVFQTWQEQTSFAGPITMNNSLFGKPYLHQSPRLMRFALHWTF